MVLIGLLVSTNLAAGQAQDQSALHVGVATCAGSNCHGAMKPFEDSGVRQNEYLIWQREDQHSKAYDVLLNDESKRIAKNLGIAAAHESKTCLVCHTDYVPESQQGLRYQIEDGVGCETCHGAAENWLGPHVSGRNSHADNIAAGLYPTSDPKQRAKLCLGCHYGNSDKPMTHQIMGAGHPPLAFELDTFSAIQPAHYVVDADYKKRKGAEDHLQIWLDGQISASRAQLEQLAAGAANKAGPWPELYYYDCNACHHSLSADRAKPAHGLEAGAIRLHDANLKMLLAAQKAWWPEQARAWTVSIDRLHAASQKDSRALIGQAGNMLAWLNENMANAVIPRGQGSKLLAHLKRLGLENVGDYSVAEQLSMAMACFEAERGNVDSPALNAMFDALENRDEYSPEQMQRMLEQ